MKVLITGANGFLGRAVVNAFSQENVELVTLTRSQGGTFCADIRYPGLWQKQLAQCQFTHVVHLAGIVRNKDIKELNKTHLEGTRNLMYAVSNSKPWFFIASSGVVYGQADTKNFPLSEDTPVDLVDFYAKSKYNQELLAEELAEDLNFEGLCVGRISNLIGPRQSELFFVGSIINKLRKCVADKSYIIETGDLEITRDFIHVKDAARAIYALSNKKLKGIFNIASGKECYLKEIAEKIIQLSEANCNINQNKLKHVTAVKRQVLSIEKISTMTNWAPKIGLIDSLKSCVEDI